MIYRCTLAAAVLIWSNLTEANVGQRDMTASAETARRHALELQMRDLAAVQILDVTTFLLFVYTRLPHVGLSFHSILVPPL